MDRRGSARYRWADEGFADFCDDQKQQQQQQQSHSSAGVAYLLLRQQVAHAMDTTGWGTVLVAADVCLSLFSVLLYIIMTYHPINALYHTDLALACVFSLNWLFWLWVAEDRLKYIFSFLTLVDVITIVPAFVLYSLGAIVNETVPGLNFLRVLRILRVLRVFRMKHIMRRHLEGAVMEAAGKLIFSLISILFIAAGLFYELERYGPPSETKKNLQFHDSIYWAAVTLTTVGYGDIAPTYWATQVMIIGLLGLTFTLLPYLTGNLMDALTSTSVYQRKSFKPSRRPEVSHVVILGFLDGATVSGLLNEMYHEDKGFNHNRTVFLSERPPSHDVEHALATHEASKKLVYLQGSPFRPEDLRRSAVESASAVFVIAPKYPEDPMLTDQYLSMAALSLGQYLQEAHSRLQDRLTHGPNRFMHWVWHGSVVPPQHLPAVYLQLCLPEGRLRLFQVLQSLQDDHGQQAATADISCKTDRSHHKPEAATAAYQPSQPAGMASCGTAAVAAGKPVGTTHSACKTDGHQHHACGTAPRSGQWPVSPDAAASSDARLGMNGDAAVDIRPSTPASSRPFSQQSQLPSGGCFGCCGTHSDGHAATDQKPVKLMPTGCQFWREYSGSIHVLCLAEFKYAMMSQSLVGVPGAMTLLCNLSTTVDFGLDTMKQLEALPSWLCDYMMGASQEVYQLGTFPGTLVGRTVREAAGFIFDSCHAVLLAVEATKGPNKHRMSVANLEQVVTEHMRGYIIADDISSVLLIASAQQGDFELWHKLRQQHLQRYVSESPVLAPMPPALPADNRPASTSSVYSVSPDQQHVAGGWTAQNVVVAQGDGAGGEREEPTRRWRSALMHSSSLELPKAAPPRYRFAAMVQRPWSNSSSSPSVSSLVGREPYAAQEPQQQLPAGVVPTSLPQPPLSVQLPQEHEGPRSSTGLGPAPVTGTSGMPAGPAQPGMSFTAMSAAVAAVSAASGLVGAARRSAPGHTSALGALIHLLRSPSRKLRKQGEAFLRMHYHLRPLGVVQSPLDIVVEEVDLTAHIIILGVPASHDGLLSMLAALRSKQLLHWRPIVIVHNKLPTGGGSWDAAAQFSDVYFVEIRDGLNDALLRASAERAAQAILMTPLTAHDQEGEDHRLASKVMTDAMVLNRFQLLKSLNPDIELITEMMLPENMAYLAPMAPVRGVHHRYLHLLAPAYMSGSVFHARLLDDLMIASYCNNASDRIVLQLLHRWHMSWANAQAFGTRAREQQQLLAEPQQLRRNPKPEQQGQQPLPQQAGQVAQEETQCYPGLLQEQEQRQSISPPDLIQAHDQGEPVGHSSSADQSRSGMQAMAVEQLRQQRVNLAATVVADKLRNTIGPHAPAAAAAAIFAQAEQRGVPTLLQIPVECSPGLTYGRYFHILLHTRGLLLLGVHRLVQQDGLSFRAAITNPSYHSLLQPDDHAFVVAHLQLPIDCSDVAAVAAAWPPDTLGFSNLDPPVPAQQTDLLVQEAAAAAAAAAQQPATPCSQPTGSAAGGATPSSITGSPGGTKGGSHTPAAAADTAVAVGAVQGAPSGRPPPADQMEHSDAPLRSPVQQQQQEQQRQQVCRPVALVASSPSASFSRPSSTQSFPSCTALQARADVDGFGEHDRGMMEDDDVPADTAGFNTTRAGLGPSPTRAPGSMLQGHHHTRSMVLKLPGVQGAVIHAAGAQHDVNGNGQGPTLHDLAQQERELELQ